MDPDSSRLIVAVTDGRGRPVASGGLASWLAAVAPARLRAEVAIALVTDSHIRKLNRQYRRKDAVTDVLSFASGEDSAFVEPRPAISRTADPRPATPRFLGDIVIATGAARRQAGEAGHAYATELRVLALHGLLHLLGYDHEDEDDGGRMARAEARLRRRGGLNAGLIARSAPSSRRKQR